MYAIGKKNDPVLYISFSQTVTCMVVIRSHHFHILEKLQITDYYGISHKDLSKTIYLPSDKYKPYLILLCCGVPISRVLRAFMKNKYTNISNNHVL